MRGVDAKFDGPKPDPDVEWIPIQEFAAWVGVIRQTVATAIANGQLGPYSRKAPNGRVFVKWREAAQEWQKRKTFAQATRHDNMLAKIVEQDQAEKSEDSGETAEESEKALAEGLDRSATYTKAKTVEKTYQAKLAEIEYNEKIGTLVRKDLIQKKTFEMARKIRNNILNIPSKIMDQLAAETDPYVIEKKLLDEITLCLEDLSDSLDGLENESQ